MGRYYSYQYKGMLIPTYEEALPFISNGETVDVFFKGNLIYTYNKEA